MVKKYVDQIKERLSECLKELQNEVSKDIGAELRIEDVFTLWVLRCLVVETTGQAHKVLTNGRDDKSCDAIHFDHKAKIISIVQTKYHSKINQFGSVNASSATINEFFEVARRIKQLDPRAFSDWLINNSNLKVNQSLKKAREHVLEDGYTLRMFFVTTGNCSSSVRIELDQKLTDINFHKDAVQFRLITHKDLNCLLMDYEDHVRPAISQIDIPIEDTTQVRLQSYLKRMDNQNKIKCWVFPVNGQVMGDFFEKHGPQLFARNVRGYMGDKSPVNKKMQRTLRTEPDMFFHYNNGITLVCDTVEVREVQGVTHLIIKHPQVINGQQTTRSLAVSIDSHRASVLLKVIQLADSYTKKPKQFHQIIGNIVHATNDQTPIRPSDLVSNHSRQLEIEKELGKVNFIYLRKREASQEVNNRYGYGKSRRFVKKLDLAVAVASCELDQHTVRSGREKLFTGSLYADIFPNKKPYYYLTRYFLWRVIGNVSKGQTTWGYARAMVTNHVWERIKGLLNSPDKEKIFVDKIFEGELTLVRALQKIAYATFVEANKFHRRNQVSSETGKVIEISQFYRNRPGRNAEFKKEERKWSKTSRKKVELGLVALKGALRFREHITSKVIDGI